MLVLMVIAKLCVLRECKGHNRPFYKCVLSCQALDLEWSWSWPCCDRDQYLVSMITKSFTFEKQQGLYHNKVNLSLTPVQRLGNQTHNCKMDYYQKCKIQEVNITHSSWRITCKVFRIQDRRTDRHTTVLTNVRIKRRTHGDLLYMICYALI